MRAHIITSVLISIFISCASFCIAGESGFTPWNFAPVTDHSKSRNNEKTVPESKPDHRSDGPAEFMIKAYIETVSRIDGDRCPMIPTCSSYGMKALRKHGFVMGMIMTFDRLIRCGGDEIYFTSPGHNDNYWKIYDPVSSNDYWWYHKVQ